MRKASEVASTPTRLRSTSAWLRIWMVATSAIKRAMSQTPTPRVRPRERAVVGLRRADMRHLEARVVSGQMDVGPAGEGELQLELDLSGANVVELGGIGERVAHAVTVADRHHGDRRGKRRSLVDHDLAFRSAEGAERGQPAPVDGDSLRAFAVQEVDDVLDVLEVDEVARLPSRTRSRDPVTQHDVHPGAVHGDEPRVGAQVGDLVAERLGGARLGGSR